jgi:uncharacterized oligopeptide transporter (OPT) family protein
LLAGGGVLLLLAGAVARVGFGVPGWMVVVLALPTAVLATMCARAAGETDIAPVGPTGTVGQALFGGAGAPAALVAGSVPNAVASSTAQTLWALATGHRVGSPVRAQLWGQGLGVIVGVAVAVPCYELVTGLWGVGSARLPAPAATAWRATAQAVSGASAVPASAAGAAAICAAIAAIWVVLARRRGGWWSALSPVALATGALVPPSFALTALVVALVVGAIQRARGTAADSVASGAAGALAGEALLMIAWAAALSAG